MRTDHLTAAAALAAAFAAALIPASAIAQTGPLTIQTQATVTVPPDRGTFPVMLRVTADTEPAARAALDKADKEARAVLARHGIGPAQIAVAAAGQAETGREPDYEACAADRAAAAGRPAAPRPGPAAAAPAASDGAIVAVAASAEVVEMPMPACTRERAFARRTLQVSTAAAAQERGLIELDSGDGVSVGKPGYTQSDPAAAVREARAKAIAQARADGDALAASMGYRITGISRISSAEAPLSLNGLVRFLAEMDGPSRKRGPEWYTATIIQTVTVDFLAVPK